MNFGQSIKQRRVEKGIGLREFCRRHNLDPSNWSKIERGRIAPNLTYEVLQEIGHGMGLEDQEIQDMQDLMDIDRGKLPVDIVEDEHIAEQLPFVFRTLRGDAPTEEELRKVVKLIRKHV